VLKIESIFSFKNKTVFLKKKKMKKILLIPTLLMALGFIACDKKKDNNETPTNEPAGPKLIFRLKLDSTQTRCDNFGQPAAVPSGHGAQSPIFNTFASHYIELAPTAMTPLGGGDVIYHGAEVGTGEATAIDFSKSIITKDGGIMYEVPISSVTPGTYTWARVSASYQNYSIKFKANGMNLSGTIASFVGYNTYIKNYTVKTQNVAVNANKLQGYWAFENDPIPYYPAQVIQGESAGVTTVPNPISGTSPIPAGSCVLTGQFPTPLTITGQETKDVVVEFSFSINKSFEWSDSLNNNIYEPLNGDVVTDMGLRGLIPKVIE
jgi:hypothetical protein